MKRLLLSLFIMALPFMASAQIRYGYFSYDAVLKAMPDYALAQRSIDDLRLKYDAEMQRAEKEFNAKYEEFLDTQRDLVPTILRKRQNELQDMMQKNEAFRKEAERLLSQASTDAFAPVRTKLNDAVRKAGESQGYAFILNTDNDAVPYIDATMGEDATPFIKQALDGK